MRKVIQNSANAFNNNRPYSEGNTTVKSANGFTTLSLHGNTIAVKEIASGMTTITNCGWQTNTTKERLNALDGVKIFQVKGVWFLNGKKWDGELIVIPN